MFERSAFILNETIGLRLIEDLKNDPEKFCEEGKSYPLLQEYFHGLSKDTLLELLYLENTAVRRVAIWITSEIGRNSTDLLKEAVMLMNDDDHPIRFFALETVAHFAFGEYFDDFIRVFSLLEDSDPKTRTSVMLIISGLPRSRIQEAYAYMDDRGTYNNSHKKGLISLINMNDLSPAEITQMIDSDDAVIRKYGIIIASKLYLKIPQIIIEAANTQDLDVRYFSKLQLRPDNNPSPRHSKQYDPNHWIRS